MLKPRRGQSVLEYAILIVIIVAALLTLQVYIKRGISGRLKSATDDIGDQYTVAPTANYYKRVKTTSNTTDSSLGGVSNVVLRDETKVDSYRHIKTNSDGEYWGEK